MKENRAEGRLLCADLVRVEWRDGNGRTRREDANLEDISVSGACVQLDCEIPVGTVIRIVYAKGELIGSVRYCIFRDIGYFAGIQFNPTSKWSPRVFRPMHLLDPRKLANHHSDRTSAR